MADIFVIRLPAEDGDPVEWLLADSTGARRGQPGRGTLEEAATAAGDAKVFALLPATDVLISSTDIPARGARLLQALPYALEEQVAQDVEELHFAPGVRRSNGRIPVAIVAKDILEAALERLRGAGISPAGLFSEAQGLSRIPGTLSVIVERDQVILNDGQDAEVAFQGLSPGDAMAAIGALDDADERAERGETERHLPGHALLYCGQETAERFELEFQALRQQLDSLEVKLLPDGALPRLAVTIASGNGINLLQGRYAPKSAVGSLWMPWRAAAGLAAALLAVTVVGSGVRYYLLKNEDERLQAQIESTFRETFPWVADVPPDIKAWVDSYLRSQGRGGQTDAPQQFLQTLESIGRAMQQTADTRIEAISYRDGVMDIRLTAPDVATLDRLRRLVDDGGRFTARIQSTDQQADGVKSRLQIQVAGA